MNATVNRSSANADGYANCFNPNSVDWDSFDLDALDNGTKYTYRRPEVLYYLYHRKEQSQSEISDRFNVSQPCISKWMDREGIDTRTVGASHRIHPDEYERVYVSDVDENGEHVSRTVGVHQLVACLDNDPYDVFDPDTDVHHETGVKCDNRPDTLSVVDGSEHIEIHYEGVVVEVDGERRLLLEADDDTTVLDDTPISYWDNSEWEHSVTVEDTTDTETAETATA